MGATDGTVQGLTTILNNGANASRLNVVLVAEGFTSTQQNTFNDACDDFVTALQAEPWNPVLGSAINVHRLNVASTDSGADDPGTCADGSAGSGATPATFFDASYCSGTSGIRRCLAGDDTLVRATLDAHLPEWHVAAVLVNASQHGGCANSNVSWTALASGFENIVLHELGHAAFDLADEYNYWVGCGEESDHDEAPTGEPFQPNVTANTSRATLKWRHLLSPGVPVPTMLNPDCTQCDDAANVLGDDTKIGLFEGAKYYHCGRFRPAYRCRMRQNGQPFCRVCVEAIAAHLAEFIPPTPVLEVSQTLLEFGDIGTGMTMYRAFEVRNRRSGFPGQLHVTLSALGGDFFYPAGVETSFTLPAPVLEADTTRLVFVAFTAPAVGGPEFFGTVDVTAIELAGTPAQVDLHARAVPPPPVDSVLVIDRSGSMSDPTGIPGKTKTDHAIEAANLYVSLLKDTDRVGIARYNQVSDSPADVLLTMRVAGAPGSGAGRLAAWGVLTPANLAAAGSTSIGAGIINGSNLLDTGVADARALVVLTDGRQNTNPDIPAGTAVVGAQTPRQRVFAVGLGLNQLEDRLQQIASFTNGVAQITGDLVDVKEFLLQKLYVQILSDASDEAFVTDPRSVVLPGQQRATNVYLGEVDVAADFIVVFRRSASFPKYMDVWLEAPDGTLIRRSDVGPGVNMEFVVGDDHVFLRCQLPVLPANPGTHRGRWKVWVRNLTGRNPTSTAVHDYGGQPLWYAVMCKARSDLRLGGGVEQTTYLPGSTMGIVVEPSLYGQPIELSAPVKVEVRRPDNITRTVVLSRDGDGTYRGVYGDTPLVGPYLIIADVSAATPRGDLVTRYRQMTGIIFVPGQDGGDHDGEGGDHERDCREARELLKRLETLVERCCREREPSPASLPTHELLEQIRRRMRRLRRPQ